MQTIHLNDVLQQMEMLDSKKQPQPFSISWWTASRKDQTGGLLRTVEKAVLTRHVKDLPRHIQGSTGSKKVNEWQNQMRNVLDLEQLPQVRYSKVHIRLIEYFNGMKVVW